MRGKQSDRILTESYLSLLPSPFVLHVHRTIEQCPNMLIVQRLQDEDPAALQQRARQLEARILRRRPDERDDAVLDPRQERVLLAFVEAMDLIAEQDRALPLILEPLFGLFDDFADAAHPFGHGRERL